MVKKTIIFMTIFILALPLGGRTEDQTNRLRSFISHYCETYESKDLKKFATFFSSDATENGVPFNRLLPNYTRNMEMIENFYYWIELLAYSSQPDTGNVKIKGKYFTKFRFHEGTWKENSGNISMELIESNESYVIKRLDYGD